MAHAPNPEIDILALIDQSDLRVRSTLRTWMQDNYDAFELRIRTRRPDWEVLAALFAKAGLTDRYGHHAKAETARKTWYRVKREVAKARATVAPPSAPRPPKPASRPANPVDDELPEDPDGPPQFDFNKARIR